MQRREPSGWPAQKVTDMPTRPELQPGGENLSASKGSSAAACCDSFHFTAERAGRAGGRERQPSSYLASSASPQSFAAYTDS